MGEAGRRFRDRGEIVASCDAATSPRSVTAFRQHFAVSSSHPRLPSAAPSRSFWNQFSNDDRSTRDPPPPTDEAWVLQVTLSTLFPVQLRWLPAFGALYNGNWLRWLPASEAPYMRGGFSGSLPLRSAFI